MQSTKGQTTMELTTKLQFVAKGVVGFIQFFLYPLQNKLKLKKYAYLIDMQYTICDSPTWS